MSLSSGSYIVSQATLVGLTGDCYFCCYILRESSFNMTRGEDEDIETRSLKF